MQKGLGIAALVIAIISIFIPILGPWLTIIAAACAAFAYGGAFALGISSLIINVVNILVLSPSVWAHGAMVSAHPEAESVVFLPWIVLGAQVVALGVLVVLHGSVKSLAATSQS